MKRLVQLVALTGFLALSLATAQTTFTYAAQADAVGLSPVLTNDQVSSVANRHIYENLVRSDPDSGELVPLLAERWETPDENTWIFHLREGVTFHDGTPFNAEAVRATFERIRDPETASPRASIMAPVDQIEVVDELTLRITTNEPYGAFLAALSHTNAAIESPAAVEEYGDLMRNPVGTGPYRFENWVSGDRISLVANDEYWGTPAQIDRFEIVVIPDANTQIALLETGEVDLVDSLPPELLARVQQNPSMVVATEQGTPVRFLSFNFNEPLWQDERAREAIASAINAEVIVNLLGEVAYGSCSIVGPEVFGYVEGAEESCTPYNPEHAAELWSQVDARPVTLWVPNTENYPRAAQIIQGQLSQAGIDVSLNTVEWGAYLSATANYEQDLFLLGWSNVTGDGSELFYPNLHSDNIGSSNRSAHSNPEAAALIDQSRETTDQDERERLIDEANRLMIADHAWVTLFHEVVLVAHSDRVQGVDVMPNGDWFISGAMIAE